jgi:cytochrome c-type biogenesis protein
MTENISLAVAFGAGVVSFISPCVLPLIPIYLAYLGGASFSAVDSPTAGVRRQTISHALLFVAGFTLVFIILGAGAGLAGGMLRSYMSLIRQASGVLLVLLGISMIGLVQIPFLQSECRFHLDPSGSVGKFRSLLLGVVFGFGWTPCIGPILGAILSLAMDSQTGYQGAFLLAVYSAGLGLPFLAAGFAMDRAAKYLRGIQRHLKVISIASGLMIMAMGALIFFNIFQRLSGLFYWRF